MRTTFLRRLGGIATAGLALWAASAGATPQPAPDGGPIADFAVHDDQNGQTVSYMLWVKILGTVLKDDGAGHMGVNYGGLGMQGREALDHFVEELSGMPVKSLDRDEQLAFWLNLYNAASLKAMFDQFNGLGNSDQDFASKNPWTEEKINVKKVYTKADNPWTERNLTVEGVSLSLDDIEYRILYANWPAQEVMYGLSCPFRGCPSLSKDAFDGGRVHDQLRAAAQRFIADPDNVKIKGDAAQLSELYKLPALGGEAKVLEHLRAAAGPEKKSALAGVTRITGYDFDWKLNGKQPPPDVKAPKGFMNRGAGTGGYFEE